MTTTKTTPTLDQLEQWANDAEAARQNLPLIFASLDVPELLDWGNESLENCEAPDVSSLDFLSEQLSSTVGDCVYWACKLIGRVGDEANACQEKLCRTLDQSDQTEAICFQAILALSCIGKLDSASLAVVEKFSASPNVRVAQTAKEILRPKL